MGYPKYPDSWELEHDVSDDLKMEYWEMIKEEKGNE